MASIFDKFPFSNYEGLNLDWVLQNLKQLFGEGEALYQDLREWKEDTTEEVQTWISNTNEALAAWKTQTESDFTIQITSELNSAKQELLATVSAGLLAIEGVAYGTQNGEPVEEGSPYYHNNCTWYKDQAAASAIESRAWANGQNSSPLYANNNSKYFRERSEAWAVGQINGTDVPDTDDAYENNAKYYADELADSTAQIATNTGDIADLKSALDAEIDSTQELVGLKSGTYANKLIRFLQGGINPNTGEFTPGRANRTTSDFLYIPTGATVSFSVETGYTKTNAIWFDASKTFLQNGNPMPLNARFVRIGVEKSDNTQNISPSEARSNTTYIVEQPVSVEGLSNNVADVDNRLKPIESWYDVYDEYIVEKENITNKVANAVFGSGVNGATYSNGVLTIPVNSTGVSSYIGVRLTGGFNLLKNNIARVKIAYDNLSGVEIEPKTLQSPNNTSLHIIDSKIDGNTVEYTFLLDSSSFTYLFLGVQVIPTAPEQTSQKVITYQGATIYSSESYGNPEKRALKMQLFGDSITDDIRVVSGSETIITTWASKIAEYMTGYDLTIVNSAVGGSGIGHGKSSTARYSTKEYNYVHDLVTDGTLETNSNVIVILIGTNNWRGEGGGAYNALGQLGDDNSGSTKTFYGYLDQICKYISDNSEALVIWITPPQRYNSADQDSPTNSLGEALNSESHTLKDFCTAIKEVANLYGMPVIDLNSNLGWNKYNVADFTSDGLHPSATKCYRITEVICGALKTYIGD